MPAALVTTMRTHPTNRPALRVHRGVSSGGQFAAAAHGSSDIALSPARTASSCDDPWQLPNDGELPYEFGDGIGQPDPHHFQQAAHLDIPVSASAQPNTSGDDADPDDDGQVRTHGRTAAQWREAASATQTRNSHGRR